MGGISDFIVYAGLTFWLWFPLVAVTSLSLSVILGIIIYKRSAQGVEGGRYDHGFGEAGNKWNSEETRDDERSKRRGMLTLEEREFLEKNLEVISKKIGKRSDYYVTAFSHNKNLFNMGSAVGGIFWLGYRGMFRELFVSFFIIGMLDSIVMTLDLEVGMGIPLGVAFGVMGNYFYFKSLQRRITTNRGEAGGALGVFFAISLFMLYLTLPVIYYNIV